MKHTHYKYKFSFIIPVYNVEDYLEETAESIFNQTMGFKENCEIIFVNDGSIDNSEEVCLRIKKRFPENIRYVKQKNAGPGAARNRGIALARGKYINLLDSDDKWSPDTLEEVYRFFEDNYDEIDLVGVKMQFFEAKTGDHPLNYKFTGDRIVDLEKEHDAIQGSAAPAFFKTEVLKEHKFDGKVGRYSEDLRFMGEVLLNNPRYGVVQKPTYYYRKRHSQTSSQDNNRKDKFWYLGTPKHALQDLISYALSEKGKVPKFLQYNIMYEMKWRFKQASQNVLTEDELRQYKSSLYGLLKYIDDDIIMEQKGLDINLKLFLLGKKHNAEIRKSIERRGSDYYFNGNLLYNATWTREIYLDLVEYEDHKVKLHGFISKPVFEHETVLCKAGGKTYRAEHTTRPYGGIYFLGDLVSDYSCFKVNVPIAKNGQNVKFSINYAAGEAVDLPIKPKRFSKLPFYTRAGSYASLKNEYLMCHPDPVHLVFLKYTYPRAFKQELRYDVFLAVNLAKNLLRHFWRAAKPPKNKTQTKGLKHGQEAVGRPTTNPAIGKGGTSLLRKLHLYFMDNTVHSPLLLRVLYHITKPFVGEIWMVSDRISAADDNGEVFFKYLSTQPNKGRKTYFIIDKHTDDYRRIKQYGRVVDFFSFKHKFLMLHASKVISSEATEFVVNPFFGKGKYLWDLLDFDFVFLQHGIIRDDISGWLNKYNKNIRLFITSAQPEYKSVIEGKYGYTSREVVLTGLARYDNLINEPQKKLIIMPTWRQNIVGSPIEGTDKRHYNPQFKESEFYNFWNNLIQDKRIATVLKAHGMEGELYLHHTLRAQRKDFANVKHIKIMDFPYDYPKAKREGSLLVTDYSSVALDFAYLKKPIIYAQFDRDTYYESSTSNQGYLSYEEKGLGPVTYTYEDTVARLIKSIETGCIMQKKYQERANEFFYKFDTHNSRRIYQAILNLDGDKYIRHAVKVPIRFWRYHWKNRNQEPVKVFWWVTRWQENGSSSVWLNFGDEVTKYLLWAIWGLKSKWTIPGKSQLIATGSNLDMVAGRMNGNKALVWGSGFIRDGDEKTDPNLDIRAVRGPKTLQRVEKQANSVAQGDPGILANLIFKASREKKYKVGVVPHYLDASSSELDAIRNNPDYLIVDVLETPDKVALDITSCEYIVSSSLHGLIFADSFGVPNNWMPLSDNVTGGDYKFIDYYQSTGRDLVSVKPSVLGDANAIHEAKQNYEPVQNLRALQKNLIKSFPLEDLVDTERG